MTTRKSEARGKMRRSAVLVTLALGAALASVAAGTVRQADAAPSAEKIVFTSNRTTGAGVVNPTGDYEIFRMNPDGTGVRQLTFNAGNDLEPILSPDGTRIAYQSEGIQTSNPQGDHEVYVMNASDGSGKKNFSNNGDSVDDGYPSFSPDGTKIAYESYGIQTSNPEGDLEVYRVNALSGSGRKNLSDNGPGVHDTSPIYSPDGTKIGYTSRGKQTSNSEGDEEIYAMNSLDGTGKKNLSNNGLGVDDYSLDFSPDGNKIAYSSQGKQTSNPEGDLEVYRMNAIDGKGQINLTNNDLFVNDSSPDFSPDGTKIAHESRGFQSSNPEGDCEVYLMNALDGSGKTNPS